ncbi:MAG TPA: GAF domain-containing protein [Anaerolineales bacterium]|nr:GAF domain-containing protein [Anaerolineales bacterium]
MLKQLRVLFAPPVFPEDEDKTRKARYAYWIALAFIVLILGYEMAARLTTGITKLSLFDLIMFAVAIILIAGLGLLRRGQVQLASILLVSLIWIASNGAAATSFGIRDTSFIINLSIILMAGLLLGWQASVVVTVLSILAGFGLAYIEQSGLIARTNYPAASFAQDMTFVFGLNAVLIYLLITGLENANQLAQTNATELKVINTDLTRAQDELQAQSIELISSNQLLEKRTERLRTVAEVARIAVAIPNFDRLLSSITQIISQQLGYYHVGIFLVNEQGEYAILRSANTEGGLKMLARGHRLVVGQEGVVGYVTRSGQPRIAVDTGSDSVFQVNPDLPFTRSELALPLKVGEIVTGALDIQSNEPDAFTDDDISILSILADQVAIAIQNARLLEQSQRALRDAEISSSQASGLAWKGYTEKIQTKGYRYDGIRPEPLKESLPASGGEDGELLLPLQLRGQMIGRLQLKSSNPSRQWTEDELAIVEATIERVALALEGARLLEDAQRRATRETFLSDMAAKLGTSFNLDSIVRDTVEELGQNLKGSTVSFQLVNPFAPPSAEVQKSNGDSATNGILE